MEATLASSALANQEPIGRNAELWSLSNGRNKKTAPSARSPYLNTFDNEFW